MLSLTERPDGKLRSTRSSVFYFCPPFAEERSAVSSGWGSTRMDLPRVCENFSEVVGLGGRL